MPVPEIDIAHVGRAHERFLNAIEGLTDEHVRRSSLLPGWTVGHVLTHVARNADSHVRRAQAALRGEMIDQYEGGYAGRQAEIEAGSVRAAAEMIDDIRQSALSVEKSWRDLPGQAWECRSRDANGMERLLFELPARRWQEIEVHLIDLDVGVSYRDWPAEFVLEWLPRTRERMWSQLPTKPRGVLFDDAAEELAWLYGRLHRSSRPELPPWG